MSPLISGPWNSGGPAPGKASALPFPRRVLTEYEAIVHHLRFLTEHIGARPVGSEEACRTARYIFDAVKGLGLSPEFRVFSIRVPLPARAKLLGRGGSLIPCWPVTGSPPTGGALHGIPRLISRRLRGGESLGAFVLSPLDSDGAGPVVAAAARSGVAGVLLYHQQVPELYSAVIPGGTVPVPCVTIRRADALQLEMQPQEVELTVEVEWTDALGVNVVVEVGRRGRPLLFLANYDTRPGAPGAYRNASGVAALLELLARLQSWREHRILVGLLDGEELGGAGSFHCKELLHAMGRLEGLRGVVYVSGLGLRRVCVVAKPPRTRSGLASLTAQCLASEGILAPMRPPRPSPPGVWSCPVVAVTGSPLALEHTALERLNVLHPRHIARAVSALDNLARTF